MRMRKGGWRRMERGRERGGEGREEEEGAALDLQHLPNPGSWILDPPHPHSSFPVSSFSFPKSSYSRNSAANRRKDRPFGKKKALSFPFLSLLPPSLSLA
jgi:hypothetical protein